MTLNLAFPVKYDYLVIGAGLFGAVFAQIVTEIGKMCLVIDKRMLSC